MEQFVAQLAIALSCAVLLASQVGGGERPIVIAHRGASGYLPEHTLAAKALAHGMGADYLEQDVVLTKDNVPVVLHDVQLDVVTNVADQFPNRAREDGKYYAIDLTLNEIKTLQVNERIDLKTGKAVYPTRFPIGKSGFQISTLTEEIEFIQGLNKSTGRNVGIYVEIKSPAWHRRQGRDISRIVLSVLDAFEYRTKQDRAYVQCFDAAETRRIREELESKLKLVQLIGDNSWDEAPTDFDELRTLAGIKRIAQYADGIGPWTPQICDGRDASGKPALSNLAQLAHDHGLEVHPFTFRADSLPDYVESFDELLHIFVDDAKVDGLFTDFPDQAVRMLADSN